MSISHLFGLLKPAATVRVLRLILNGLLDEPLQLPYYPYQFYIFNF
jgi:hypothetical protein